MSHDARKRETPGSSQLDEWGLLAWPAFEERRIDGWLLRFAEGHTKRANAVYPMNPLKADLSKAIARCERFYRDRGQQTIFRMTASCCPLELDRVLDQRGYAFIDRTWVLERALCQSSLQEPEESLSEIAMEIVPIEQWLDAFQRLGIMDVSSMALRRRLIRVVKGETIPLLAKQGERVLGLNLGIRTGEGIGLFGLYVGEDARRRGIGRGLVKAALQAGLAAGARTAYLQVEDSNEAARGLYEELGFQPSHDYWYRVSTSCAPTRRAIENHFDQWAKTYDQSVARRADYPFAGYGEVLGRVAQVAGPLPTHRILDVGVGIGNLSEILAPSGCDLWGTDISSGMIEKARRKIPAARLLQADLLGPWPEVLPACFDRIVSAYVFHHFDTPTKIDLVKRLIGRLSDRGRLILADIAFEKEAELSVVREAAGEAWDPSEHYWIADQMIPKLAELDVHAEFEAISSCAGIFIVQP